MFATVSDFGYVSWSLALWLLTLLFLWSGSHVLQWAWFTPRRLEQQLRSQGLSGTVYQSPTGDLKEITRVNRETWATPMPLSHDITSRVSPFFYRNMKEHGKTSFTWFGVIPRVLISDPETVKEILSNKLREIEKQKLTPVGKLLGDGLFSYKGQKWASHRRILNPSVVDDFRICPSNVASSRSSLERLAICMCDTSTGRSPGFSLSSDSCSVFLMICPGQGQGTECIIAGCGLWNDQEAKYLCRVETGKGQGNI